MGHGKTEKREKQKRGAGKREIFVRKAGGSQLKNKEKRICSSFPLDCGGFQSATSDSYQKFSSCSSKTGNPQPLFYPVCLSPFAYEFTPFD